MTPEADQKTMDAVPFLYDLLVCPVCQADLTSADSSLTCVDCGRVYPVCEGIPELALLDTSFTLQSETGEFYQKKYTNDEASADYDRQFIEVRHKQARTDRELAILHQLLTLVDPVERLLNIPCGGGRLSEPLSKHCSALVEADVAFAQASYARTHGIYQDQARTAFLTASAFQAPFATGSFDGVVCARLLHHFSATADHQRLVDELCRIATRFVILSFNDSVSVKAVSRQLRGKPNPMTLRLADVERLAHGHGFNVLHTLSVSPFGSRHRYALLQRSA